MHYPRRAVSRAVNPIVVPIVKLLSHITLSVAHRHMGVYWPGLLDLLRHDSDFDYLLPYLRKILTTTTVLKK